MRDKRRDRRYDSPGWRMLRKHVLERDGYQCQLRLDDRCTHIATQVDHKIEPSKGGQFFDEWNCRASCGHCNVAKRNRGIADDARTHRANNRGPNR